MLAATLLTLLRDPAAAQAQRVAFRSLLAGLQPVGGTPSAAAAAAVLQLVDQDGDLIVG